MTYTYGADYERSKSILKQGNNTLITHYYFSGYKKDITGSTTRFIHYISGPTGHYRIFMAPNLPGYDIKTQFATCLALEYKTNSINAKYVF